MLADTSKFRWLCQNQMGWDLGLHTKTVRPGLALAIIIKYILLTTSMSTNLHNLGRGHIKLCPGISNTMYFL